MACWASPALATIIKGKPTTLVRDGEVQRQAMRRTQVSRQDLEEDMRLSAELDDIEKIKLARLEASGDVSFVQQSMFYPMTDALTDEDTESYRPLANQL